MDKTLLIMAAGNGSRYGSLKQFDELGPENEYLLEFSLYDAIDSGFNHIVMVTKENYVDELNSYLRKRLPEDVKLDVIAQRISDVPEGIEINKDRKKPWGTAHAVWVTKDLISNSFAVINADDFYGRDAFKYASEFMDEHPEKDVMGVVPYKLDKTLSDYGTVSRGVCVFEGDELVKIHEYKELERKNSGVIDHETGDTFTGEERVSMNFWVCKPKIYGEIEKQFIDNLKEGFGNKQEIYIPIVIQDLVKAGEIKVNATPTVSSWFGVTYAQDKSNAVGTLKELTENKEYPSPLWKS